MKHSVIAMLILFIFAATQTIAGNKTEKKIPDYSNLDRSKVPVAHTWKIDDIYPSFENWNADKKKAIELIAGIDEKAKGWTSSPEKMLSFLKYLNSLEVIGEKLYGYVSNQSNMDMGNTELQKLKGELQNMFVNFQAKVAFIEPDILKLGKNKFEQYLKSEPKLKPYKKNIESILRLKKHILDTDKEQIVAMTGLFSGAPSQASGMLNNVDIPRAKVTLSDGKTYELNYQTYARLRASKKQKDRQDNMLAYWNNHKNYENTFAILQDSVIKGHLFNSRIRGYKSCLQAQLYPQNIDLKVYKNLITAVRANLKPLHRYLQIKKELLRIDKFLYADIYASAVAKVERKYSVAEAESLITEMMRPLGSEYTEVLETAFTNRWMDLYPNKGKQSGAYSSSVYGVHPYIKLNYNGNYNSVSTMAHELGHGLHSFFSNKYQHFATHDYPIFLAEIASTFNENMLMHHLLKVEKDDLFKLYIIDNYLEQLRGTIYRQTLFAEFELAMHEHVENGNSLTADWLNKKYLELTRLYYGHDKNITEVGDYIQNEWSAIPHFFYNFYVYQYSTGIVASMALSEMVLEEGESARERYMNFLKAGGSKYPLETLKDAGVDLTTPEPVKAALNRFDELVTEMEKIAEKLKKQNKI